MLLSHYSLTSKYAKGNCCLFLISTERLYSYEAVSSIITKFSSKINFAHLQEVSFTKLDLQLNDEASTCRESWKDGWKGGCPDSFSYCSLNERICVGFFPKALSGHILFINLYVMVDRSNFINYSTLSQLYDQLSLIVALSIMVRTRSCRFCKIFILELGTTENFINYETVKAGCIRSKTGCLKKVPPFDWK